MTKRTHTYRNGIECDRLRVENITVLKTYDGECNVQSYYCKGHIEPTLFIAALEKYEDETCDIDEVEHLYFRHRPLLPHEKSEWSIAYWLDVTKPGRGAFPVTVTDHFRFIDTVALED